MRKFILFSLSLFILPFTASKSLAQCASMTFSASADKANIICGQAVKLSAFSYDTTGNYILYANFNNSSLGTDFTSTPNVMFNNPCGKTADGTPHFWMGRSIPAPRNLTTRNLDLSSGAILTFQMRYEQQPDLLHPASSSCEGPDLPDEGVYLEYSIDNGLTWRSIQYWDPLGGNNITLINWNKYQVILPLEACTANTKIRWAQKASSGNDFDHWGLDNIKIYGKAINYHFNWTFNGSTSATTFANPASNSVFRVYLTNGTDSCFRDLAVTVKKPSIIATSTPTTFCDGSSALLNATVSNNSVSQKPSSCALSSGDVSGTSHLQTVGVGTIVGSNSTWTNPEVYANFNNSNKIQILYKAAELTAAGLSAGQIKSIAFDIASIAGNATTVYNNFEIKMKCTNLNSFPTTNGWQSGLVTVFPAQTINIATGWNTHVFPKSYDWDGVSNLLVEICFDNGNTWTYNAPVRRSSTTFNSTYIYGSISPSDPACSQTTFGDAYMTRPNTKFNYYDDVVTLKTWKYLWTPTTGLSDPNTSNPVLSGLSANTSYVVSYSDSANPGCFAKDTLLVNYSSSSALTAPTASPKTICNGTSATLTASAPSGTIQWLNTDGTSAGTGTTIITSPLFATTKYYAQATNGTCTSQLTPVIVTVNGSTPETMDTISCSGNTASLEAFGPSGTYEWYDAPTGGNLLHTGMSYTTPVLNNDVNFFVQSTINGCTSTRVAAKVKVNGLTPASFTNSSCSTGARTLNGISLDGGVLQWFADSVGGSLLATGNEYITPYLTSSTTYYFQSVNGSCISKRAKATVLLTTVSNPTVKNDTICSGDSLLIQIPSVPNGTLDWYNVSGGGTMINQGTSLQTPVLTSDSYYYVENAYGGCKSMREQIYIMVRPSVVPSVSISADKVSICKGETISFSSSVVNEGSNPSYIWKINGQNSGSTNAFSTSDLNNNDKISCTLISNAECAVPQTVLSDSIGISLNDPHVNIKSDNIKTCLNTEIEVSCDPLSGTNNYYWDFYNGITSSTVGNDAGPYYVKWTQSGLVQMDLMVQHDGCWGYDTLFVTVNPEPVKPVVIQYFDSLKTSSFGTYQWFLNGFPIPGSTTKAIKPANNGCYSVQIADTNGCFALSDSICITITGIKGFENGDKIEMYPNPFSLNTTFFIQSHELLSSNNLNLIIFDVLGKQILPTTKKSVSGMKATIQVFKESIPSGVYFYKLMNGNQLLKQGKMVIE